MNLWSLPVSATIGGTEFPINSDFRDILEIVNYLNDYSKPLYIRWQIALSLFYEGDIPQKDQAEAIEYLVKFISYGETEDKPGPKVLDWEQDAQIIIGDINKVAGKEIRCEKFIHWWTFLSYFYGIGEGQLSTIVSIRSKKRSGKKLEKWEEEFYKKNKSKVDLQKPKTTKDTAAQEYFKKWL